MVHHVMNNKHATLLDLAAESQSHDLGQWQGHAIGGKVVLPGVGQVGAKGLQGAPAW